jgi:uncharacterized repeat protein (TIGR03803 family)
MKNRDLGKLLMLGIFILLNFILVSCSGGGGGGGSNTPNLYTLGGTITGLTSNQQVVLLNSTNLSRIAVSTNGTFQFKQTIASGSNYSVTVIQQPTNQTCTVNNGSGVNINHNITNITVVCSTTTYTIGGTVSGLTSGQSVSLVNNNDLKDTLNITANGNFTFTLPVAQGGNYTVTINKQPANETCSVNSASGVNVNKNISSVSVVCSSTTYTIGGTVSGLTSGQSVSLVNNGDTKTALTVTANGSFTLQGSLPAGANYTVAVATQPANEICSVANGVGNNLQQNITNISVICDPSNTYTIGGNLTGLANGQSISLVNNGDTNNALTLTTNGTFTFPTPVVTGTSYAVTIVTQPANEICSIINATGTNVTANVNNISVSCGSTNYTYANYPIAPQGGAINPSAALIQGTDGNFYGTTTLGGTIGNGTVFKITESGIETVLYNFGTNPNDGANPKASLTIGTDGNFYGTTYSGGTDNKGIVFKITPSGMETVLYRFLGGSNDGANPAANLIIGTDGNFYGTTYNGGTDNKGIVFKITGNGVETVL